MNPYRDRNRDKAYNMLGNKCAHCGMDDRAEFHLDHIDPSTKLFDVAKNWTRAWAETETELSKCQILCKECHHTKSRVNGELRGGHNKWDVVAHGTLHAYCAYACRCVECKEAKRLAAQASYLRRKQNKVP